MNEKESNRVKLALNYIKSRYEIPSQDEIAYQLGITSNYMSGVIKGTFPLSDKLIRQFESVFGVNPKYMTGESQTVWTDTEPVPTNNEKSVANSRIDAVVNAIKARYGYKTNTDICKSLGVGNSYLSDIKKGKYNMRQQNKLAFKFVFGVNPLYFDGKSDDMWIDGFRDNNIIGNGNTTVMGYHNEVSQSEQLSEAMKQISKAQQQIDRLLTIIENMQKQ